MYVWNSNGGFLGSTFVQSTVVVAKKRGEDIADDRSNIYSISVLVREFRNSDDRGRFTERDRPISSEIRASGIQFNESDQLMRNMICNCGDIRGTCLECNDNGRFIRTCTISDGNLEQDRMLRSCERNTSTRIFYSIPSVRNNSIFFRYNDKYISLYFTPISRYSTTGI